MQTSSHHFEEKANQLIRKVNRLKDRSKRQFAYRAAILTIYGFQVAIPVLLGIGVGTLMDKAWPYEHFSWVLNFILIGFLVGLYNANNWFYINIGLKKTKKGGKK